MSKLWTWISCRIRTCCCWKKEHPKRFRGTKSRWGNSNTYQLVRSSTHCSHNSTHCLVSKQFRNRLKNLSSSSRKLKLKRWQSNSNWKLWSMTKRSQKAELKVKVEWSLIQIKQVLQTTSSSCQFKVLSRKILEETSQVLLVKPAWKLKAWKETEI